MHPETATIPASAPRSRPSAARVAFLVHSAAGLWLFVLLSVVMVTGTVAVFGAEIDRLAHPQLRVSPPSGDAPQLTPGALYDAVLRAYPGMGVNYVNATPGDRTAALAGVTLPGNVRRTVSIDPYTGQVLGELPPVTARGFLRQFHAVLFQGMPGLYAVNLCSVLLLVSLVTGLIAYRKFWRGLFKRPRFDRNPRVWLGGLHRLTALWSVWFLLVMIVTGGWYFYNYPLVKWGLVPDVIAPAPAPPTLSTIDLDALGPATPVRPSGAEIVNAVLAAYPDLTVTGLVPPGLPKLPFVVYGERGEFFLGGRANAVYVNPFTAGIMGADLSEDTAFSRHLFPAMSNLHHGTFLPRNWGGDATLAMKCLWFLGGVALSFLTVSGLLIFLKRTRRAAADLAPAGKWQRAWGWLKPWGEPMGVCKYVNVLVVAAIVAGVMQLPFSDGGVVAPEGRHFAARAAGPFEVSLIVSGPAASNTEPIRPSARVMVFPRFSGTTAKGFADARSIHVGTSATGKASRGRRANGAENIAHASLRLPKELHDAWLWIEIHGWDGRTHRVQWALQPGQGNGKAARP